MPDRKVHFAGSMAALIGYAFAPCGARLHDSDPTTEDEVTCKRCLQWIGRYHERRVVAHEPTE